MKSWLIVLAPILFFGFLMATGKMAIPGSHAPKPPAAKVNGKDKAGNPAADASSADPAAKASDKPAGEVTPTTEQPKADPVVAKAEHAKPAEKTPLPPKATVDQAKGDKRLAKLWNEMDASTLAKLVEKWKDDELARVLAVMDNAKVVELLTHISGTNPERASNLSRQLQKLASVVPPPPAGQ